MFGSLPFQTAHRPWLIPSKPWVFRQSWVDLCFVHFEVPEQVLRSSLPPALEVDTFQGKAWIGLVPFGMQDVMIRPFPNLLYFSAFNEFNVRTYVIYQGKPGVYFFSLDCPNRVAIWIGNRFFKMPYLKSDIVRQMKEDKTYFYCKRRNSRKVFEANYRPISDPLNYPKDSFEIWATERYCCYSRDKNDHCYRCEIQHLPWPLQKAEIEIIQNDISDFDLGEQHPSVLYSKKLEVIAWPLKKL